MTTNLTLQIDSIRIPLAFPNIPAGRYHGDRPDTANRVISEMGRFSADQAFVRVGAERIDIRIGTGPADQFYLMDVLRHDVWASSLNDARLPWLIQCEIDCIKARIERAA